MTKGFFDNCNISEAGSVCFWLLLPIAVVIWIHDVLF